jgi:hypothetical protein
MPIRNGRWVSRAVVADEVAILAVAAAASFEPATEPAKQEPKRSRRSTKAAVAAIKEATGLTVDLGDS